MTGVLPTLQQQQKVNSLFELTFVFDLLLLSASSSNVRQAQHSIWNCADQTFRGVIENQILQSIHFYLTYTEIRQTILILILSVN